MRSISILSPTNVSAFSFNQLRERGLGGTETCILLLSKYLSDLGADVSLFGPFPVGHEGKLKLFPYAHAELMDHDLFIYARNLWQSDSPDIRYNQGAVWVHDTGFNSVNKWRLNRIDRILALTQWHKKRILEEYPYVNPGSILVTQNGIRSDKFKYRSPKVNGKFIYSSGPDRGLKNLIDMWPAIKKSIPAASLHIFNGFDLWEACNSHNNATLNEINEIKSKIKDYKSLDVHHRGLVGQDELAKEMSESLLWLYPTDFTETFCISAVEAQCAGCRVVASNLAALKETVHFGQLIDGDSAQSEYRNKFIQAVKEEYENYNTNDISSQNRFISNKYDWKSTAKQWISDYLNTSSLPGYGLLDSI